MTTKSQINKLGKSLRLSIREGKSIDKVDLEKLQAYRTSFKDDIAPVFENVARLSKKIRKDSLTSLRIKRIESILSKIKREPTMSLGNMGDIAGCRVITHSKSALSLIRNQISEIYEITNVKDYVSKPKPDGYRGYHIYIKSPVNEHKQVEIQLRHVKTHKWASLVEIIDIIYDLKLKEGQKHPDLQDFLYLLSLDKDDLNKEQIAKIIEIDSQHNIYKNLNQVFIQNHIPIRKAWLEENDERSHSYFIIEVDQEKKSNIKALENYQDAEKEYFKMFLSNQTSNFVLIFIENPKFKEVCVAYASYMMIKHDYLDDWNYFAKKTLRSESKNGEIKSYNTYKDLVDRNLKEQQDLITSELKEIEKHVGDAREIKGIATKDWINELGERIKNIDEFSKEIQSLKPPRKLGFFEKIFK